MAIKRYWLIEPNVTNAIKIDSCADVHGHVLGELFDCVLRSTDLLVVEPVLLAYAGQEHIGIGQRGYNLLSLRDILGARPFLVGKPPVSLTYGEIVALAGDYYSRFDENDDGYTGYRWTIGNNQVVGQPIMSADDIADSIELARRSQSAEDAEHQAMIGNVRVLIERRLEDAWILPGTPSENQERQARQWFTSRSLSEFRMSVLALENWDHFHPYCISRYVKLQRRAKEMAASAGLAWSERKIHRLGSPGRQDLADEFRRAIHDALAMNAFANHFLTDAFSSGHFYANRKADYDRRGAIREIDAGRSVDPNVDPDRELIELHNTRVFLGEVLVGAVAKDEHDCLGRGTRAVCSAHRDEVTGRLEPFDAVGDWQLNPSDLGAADLNSTSTQVRYLVSAVASSIQEVIDSFLGFVRPWNQFYGSRNLLSPLEYIPHRYVPNNRHAVLADCSQFCIVAPRCATESWRTFPQIVRIRF